MSFETVTKLEKRIGEFFGAPYVVCLDACTHGIELCLRYQKLSYISVPRRTYVSVPFLANKLNISLEWRDEEWEDYYVINRHFKPIYDAGSIMERRQLHSWFFYVFKFSIPKTFIIR